MQPTESNNKLDNQNIEKLIDEIGRDRVFSRAKQLGWKSTDSPPIWVWHGIVNDLKSKGFIND